MGRRCMGGGNWVVGGGGPCGQARDREGPCDERGGAVLVAEAPHQRRGIGGEGGATAG